MKTLKELVILELVQSFMIFLGNICIWGIPGSAISALAFTALGDHQKAVLCTILFILFSICTFCIVNLELYLKNRIERGYADREIETTRQMLQYCDTMTSP